MIREFAYSEFTQEKLVDRVWIDDNGREILDKTPVSVPLKPPVAPSSMFDLVHRLYQQMREAEIDVESFEDADDFDVPDDLGIEMRNTPYEQDFDHVAVPAEPPSQPPSVPAEPPEPEEITS